MPRRPRLCPPGIPQHIIQRGNNRSPCFACDADRAAYANWLREAAERYDVEVHAWVFMTNHVHLLVTPLKEGGASKMMQYIGRLYVRFFNQKYRRTGTLWEGRHKSCLVGHDAYLEQILKTAQQEKFAPQLHRDWSSATKHLEIR